MSTEWYLNRGGKQRGPVSAAQLRKMVSSGYLSPDDLLWKEGMPKWIPANKVKGLFPLGPPSGSQLLRMETPATTPVAETGDNPLWQTVSPPRESAKSEPRRRSKKSQAGLLLLLIIPVALIMGVVVWLSSSANKSTSTNDQAGGLPPETVIDSNKGGPAAMSPPKVDLPEKKSTLARKNAVPLQAPPLNAPEKDGSLDSVTKLWNCDEFAFDKIKTRVYRTTCDQKDLSNTDGAGIYHHKYRNYLELETYVFDGEYYPVNLVLASDSTSWLMNGDIKKFGNNYEVRIFLKMDKKQAEKLRDAYDKKKLSITVWYQVTERNVERDGIFRDIFRHYLRTEVLDFTLSVNGE